MSSSSTRFFEAASNVSIRDSSWVIVSRPQELAIDGSTRKCPLDELSSHCAFGAFLFASERGIPPRCSPKTRGKLIFDVKSWVKGGEMRSSAMWLVGSAGSGKTALSQTTAEELKEEGHVLGCHFFSRTSKDGRRSDGTCWAPNMVHQMVRVLPETLSPVEKAISGDSSLFSQHTDAITDDLFVKPLMEAFGNARPFAITNLLGWLSITSPYDQVASARMSTPRLVVVDGLDECSSQELQEQIIETIARLVTKLPIPLRFLIASRPETHIRTAISREFGNSIRQINLDEDLDARQDIREYFTNRFDLIRRTHPALRGQDAYETWPTPHDLDILVQKSSLAFIFANTVMNYIDHKTGHPAERLKVILGLTITPQKDKPYLPIDTLYKCILSGVEDDHLPIVLKILTIIYITGLQSLSHPARQLESSPQYLDNLLGFIPGKVSQLLDPLVSILVLPHIPRDPILMLHASFFDYLLNPMRSGELVMNLNAGFEAIAIGFFDSAQRLQSWSNPDSPFPVDQNVLDAILYHTSKARMSFDLAIRLYALQENLGTLAIARDTKPHQREIRRYIATIGGTLLFGLGSHYVKVPVDQEAPNRRVWVWLEQYRTQMATLIAHYTCEEGRDSALKGLIAQMRTRIGVSWLSKPVLSGYLETQTCQRLIRQLIRLKPEKLLREDFMELLNQPFYFADINERPDKEFASEVVAFLSKHGHDPGVAKLVENIFIRWQRLDA